MTRAEVEDYAVGSGVDLLFADGFDDCIVGVGRQFTKTFVVYDLDAVIRTLVGRDGMSWAEAEEFFEVNVVGGWVGDATPCFVQRAV